MSGFVRTQAGLSELGFVRGPAMIYAAPLTTAPPADFDDVILPPDTTPVNEVQSLAITGTPTGGNFKLSFRGAVTGVLPHSATSAAVQAALEALTTVGFGNVVCSGGPLPASAVVLTFQGSLAGTNVPLVTVVTPALTGGTTPAAAVTVTTPGVGPYDPVGAWFALGATKDGVNPTYNNTEDEFTIDQQLSIIGALPNQHTWAFTTSLVEVSLENLSFVTNMGAVTLNTVPDIPVKKMGMGSPTTYNQWRIAIIHRRTNPGALNGLLRMHFYRIAQRQASEVAFGPYQASGDQIKAALQMRGLGDETVSDPNENVGYILDQVLA